MCPNHVENFVDSDLVTSTSLTERLRLWNKHARAPVNQDAVRLQFFRKVRTGKLYQKSNLPKISKPPDFRIKVPEYIKEMYKKPVEGFPVEQGPPRQPETEVIEQKPAAAVATPSVGVKRDLTKITKDEDEWLKQLVALQTGILRQQMTAAGVKEEDEVVEGKGQKANKQRPTKAKLKTKSKNAPGHKKVKKVAPGKKGVPNGRLSPKSLPARHSGSGSDDNEDQSSSDTASECSLGMEDEDGVSADVQAEICDYIARHRGRGGNAPQVNLLDPTIRDFLAFQRMNELFGVEQHHNGRGVAVDTPSDAPNSEVQIRAALVPLDNPKCRDSLPIRRRCVEVGMGSKVAIDLSKMGVHCNYVSPHHATIFFDQYSRVYELINYSEHGTIVDNIVYTLDSSSHKADLSKAKRAKFAQLKTMSASLTPAGAEGDVRGACHCVSGSVAEAAYRVDHGCENSAVLHHGSFLRFGCLQFAFSVVDYQDEGQGNDPDEAIKDEDTTKKEEEVNDDTTTDDIKSEIKVEDEEMESSDDK